MLLRLHVFLGVATLDLFACHLNTGSEGSHMTDSKEFQYVIHILGSLHLPDNSSMYLIVFSNLEDTLELPCCVALLHIDDESVTKALCMFINTCFPKGDSHWLNY